MELKLCCLKASIRPPTCSIMWVFVSSVSVFVVPLNGFEPGFGPIESTARFIQIE